MNTEQEQTSSDTLFLVQTFPVLRISETLQSIWPLYKTWGPWPGWKVERWAGGTASPSGPSALHTTSIQATVSGPIFVGLKIFSTDLGKV